MKSSILTPVIALLICSSLFSQTVIFQDNFDSYLNKTGIASQSTSWQTWSYTTGTSEDALISNEQAQSASNSLNIINDNDIIYYFGSKVSGAYNVEFSMFIKTGFGAYLNIEHGNRSKYAFQIYFKENNEIWFDNGTDSLQLATFTTNEWFTFKFSIDLNSDDLIIYQNSANIGEFAFSRAMNTPSNGALGLIDFYGANNTPGQNINNSDFFIDDFKFIEVTPPDPVSGCDFLNYFVFGAQTFNNYYSDLGSAGEVISTLDNFDDANSDPVNIGFTFKYNCQDFTKFILNTNGFIKLGDTPPSSTTLFYGQANTKDNGIFNSNNPADINLISPFNHDLMAGTGTPEYRIYTEGEAPYRMCTIQFKNLRDKTTSPPQQYDNIEFQIRLTETTNIIEFVYGNWIPSANESALKTAACGLKGSTFSDEDLLVVTKGSTSNWNSASFSNADYTVNAFNFGIPPQRPLPDNGLTYRFTPAYESDLKINEIYTLGTASIVHNNPQVISASISNLGLNTMTNVDVKLEVYGTADFTNIVTIPSILPKTSVTVNFEPFISAYLGTNAIYVSLPDDNQTSDNLLFQTQNITEDQQRYVKPDTEPDIYWGYGANNGGILLSRYQVKESAKVYSVDAFIVNTGSIGKPVYAVVLNQDGTILGQSEQLIIQEEDLNSWHSFVIAEPPLISSGSFFAGFAIPPVETGNYPLGVQRENPCRSGAYFWSPIGGGSVNPSSVRFMIGATLISATGIRDGNKTNTYIQIFPNPAKEILTISGISGLTSAEIYSISGVLLKTYFLDQFRNDLNISDLSTGVYVLKIARDKEYTVKRLIKH